MGWGWRRSSSSSRSKSSYRPPSSNWRNLTQEEASGPAFSDAVWYSTTAVKSNFGLTTDNLRTITGYRNANKHYGGGNNLTLYRERDILMFMDRRAGKEPQTAAAIEERRLQFRKERADQAQAVRDRADPNSVVPATRLGNLQTDRLKVMVRFYEGRDGGHAGVQKNDLVERLIQAGYTEAKEKVRQEGILAAAELARQRREAYLEKQRVARVAQEAKWAKEREAKAKAYAATLANIAEGTGSWADLSYRDLYNQCRKRGLKLVPALGVKKLDLVARIELYESQTEEERRATALGGQAKAEAAKVAAKAKREAELAARNAEVRAERERLRLRLENAAKKAKKAEEEVAATIAKIAVGTAVWSDLNCFLKVALQKQCQKRKLDDKGNKAALIERIEQYEEAGKEN